ncbi:MAG: hypothetical protein GEU98_23330 [Pseudonocardiaceae bacterium]|nr:hypothetical protein [Pseudonocardiaceae bacterium]
MVRKKHTSNDAQHAADEPRITPAKAKNYLKVAKIVGPVVVPVIAPLAVQAAGALRERYDRYRAHQLGVPVERLAEFSGRGAALHARIAGVNESLAELRGKADGQFVEEKTTTLRQLAAAVRAAERMPAPRRKAAHRAVAAQLDELESEVLHRFGV